MSGGLVSLTLRRGYGGGSGMFAMIASWAVHAAIWRFIFRFPLPIVAVILIAGLAFMWWRRSR